MLAPPKGGIPAPAGPVCTFEISPPSYTKEAHTARLLRRTAGLFTNYRVDSADSFGPGKIGTIGTAQLYEPLSVAPAN